MENFYNWITQPVPKEDVEIWFNIHNMIPERVHQKLKLNFLKKI